jgi:hypothetical protein
MGINLRYGCKKRSCCVSDNKSRKVFDSIPAKLPSYEREESTGPPDEKR